MSHFFRTLLDLFADILTKRVRIFEGRVASREEDHTGLSKRDDTILYYFDTKICRFKVDRRTFLALDTGGAYRVYYLGRSKTLVAMEPAVLAQEAEQKEEKLKQPTVIEGSIVKDSPI